MTNKDILYKVMKKAIKNGLEINLSLPDFEEILEYNKHITPVIYYWIIFSHVFAKAFWGDAIAYCRFCGGKYTEEMFKDESLWKRYDKNTNEDIIDQVGCIYNREKDYHIFNVNPKTLQLDWTYHLQHMVLEKEPLKYLERYL